MTTQEKVRRNPDYSGSAVNLCNPKAVEKLLDDHRILGAKIFKLQSILQKFPEARDLKIAQEAQNDVERMIKTAIDTDGSFQDVEKGWYALKQRKISITYLPEKVREVIPKFAEAVIQEVVNKTAIEGLLKGKLITEEEAKVISKEKESFVYIIK